ncbi:MAG: acetaldehyde dehydrogenase (acetylating) [Synergistaceae bacterium]|nr:acetaldehyde dehydrogenase (acetylating) [Synergistaceae bacterium]
MQLRDKDLLSVQEVRELVGAAKEAQATLAEKDQEYVDRLCKSIARAGVRNAERLGVMAWEETGFGVPADKKIKNVFASRSVYEYIKELKTVGVIGWEPEKRLRTIAVPLGVIAGLIPSTNPTSTAFYKALISIKAGNAIVFSPHPQAKRCILESVKVIRQAISEAGGDENLVCCITTPTIEATDSLMRHTDVALILATGGAAMVRAAYSSGTPAIGVGPGNGPSFIEQSADLKLAVRQIVASKTFDNGTVCASEQSIICTDDYFAQVKAEMESQGCYFLNAEEREQLGKYILRANGTMNPEIVGRNAQVIAGLANISIPNGTKIIVAMEDGVGRGHPYSNEKLAPILAFFTAPDCKAVCEKCEEILHYEGAGHTFSIHTQNEEIVSYFARRIPATRIIVNTGSTFGGIGATTGLPPALTLGCGAEGGSSTSDNVGPLNLINRRFVAYPIRTLAEIKASMPECPDGICESSLGTPSMANVDVDMVVAEILKRLKAF